MDTEAATDLDALESALVARIARSDDEAALETVRVEALGKQGVISGLMRTLGQMSPEQRSAFGAKLNTLKDRLGEALLTRKATLAEAALEAKLRTEKIDVSLPAAPNGIAEERKVSCSSPLNSLRVCIASSCR